MKDMYTVIKAPVVTEKTTLISRQGNKVAFWVATDANKKDIKTAVEKLFNVKVLGVNTYKLPGKIKKLGKYSGKTSVRKKAYITLKQGDKIDIFENK